MSYACALTEVVGCSLAVVGSLGKHDRVELCLVELSLKGKYIVGKAYHRHAIAFVKDEASHTVCLVLDLCIAVCCVKDSTVVSVILYRAECERNHADRHFHSFASLGTDSHGLVAHLFPFLGVGIVAIYIEFEVVGIRVCGVVGKCGSDGS